MKLVQIRSIIRLFAVCLSLSLISLPALETEARPRKTRAELRKAKKLKAKKARRRRARKQRAKKVTYKKILKWWKAGTSNDRIIARARKAGYVASDKDIKRLKKRRVSANLLAALQGVEAPQRKVARTKKIDIHTIYSDDDMDFDSVPPPKGLPAFVQNKRPAAKKSIDRSLRPSAPFKNTKSTNGARSAKRRTVVAATD